MFRRNKIYSINKKAANEALQNVFAACEHGCQTCPLFVAVPVQRLDSRPFHKERPGVGLHGTGKTEDERCQEHSLV